MKKKIITAIAQFYADFIITQLLAYATYTNKISDENFEFWIKSGVSLDCYCKDKFDIYLN